MDVLQPPDITAASPYVLPRVPPRMQECGVFHEKSSLTAVCVEGCSAFALPMYGLGVYYAVVSQSSAG